jgi:hypothetical protein
MAGKTTWKGVRDGEINIPEIQRKGNVVPDRDWRKCTALQLLYI